MDRDARSADRRRPSTQQGQLRDALVTKAHELFSLCDKEDKGFVSKRDMQRLQGELPLGPDQLEVVFDSLDVDANGFLTLEEFTDGFGMFLGFDKEPRRMSCIAPPVPEEHKTDAKLDEEQRLPGTCEEDEDDEMFEEFLDSLGAQNIFRDEDYVKDTWTRLRQEDPIMLRHFEEFLGKVTTNIKNSESECTSLGHALLSRKYEQVEHVERLYEEMETQHEMEKEQLLAEERLKERKLREELEDELRQKDQLLQELIAKHVQLEHQLNSLNTNEAETKQENARLLKEMQRLECRLRDSEAAVDEMQRRVGNLRHQSLEEKRRRAKTALQVTENIALEREDLVKQLDMLRNINKELLDQKDEINILMRRHSTVSQGEAVSKEVMVQPAPDHEGSSAVEEHKRRTLVQPEASSRRGSRMSDYIKTPTLCEDVTSFPACDALQLEEECEVDDSYFDPGIVEQPTQASVLVTQASVPGLIGEIVTLAPSPPLGQSAKSYCALGTNIADQGRKPIPRSRSCELYTAATRGRDSVAEDERSESGRGDSLMSLPTSTDGGRDGHDPVYDRSAARSPAARPAQRSAFGKVQDRHQDVQKSTLVHPERIFKVVIVGDSAVGKTCFINRFCKDTFVDIFRATVGVDFQVKSVTVDGRSVALQLWDTAGQERFRSITKQYYRKADGVIVMYDVCSERSFSNVRGWAASIEEGVNDDVVVMLLGNKSDLEDGSIQRAVSHKDGEKVAHEIGAQFYETSAKTGQNVNTAMQHLASLLKIREDEEIDKAVQLQMDTKKKQCC